MRRRGLRRVDAIERGRASRAASGAAVAPIVRAAVELARGAIAAPIELRIELADARHAAHLRGDELEALVLAVLLDAAVATRLALVVRERTIERARWIELVRIDDRPGEIALVLEPPSLAGVADQIARSVSGELSLAPGRAGTELAIAVRVCEPPAQSSSSS